MANGNTAGSVTIAGGGMAGLVAAHRLLQRGFDVTLIEANDFLGGKLGAHRDVGDDAGGTPDGTAVCPACAARGGCLRSRDWHEHCYHMYLNWYHNFWELIAEIGALDRFIAAPAVFNLPRGRQGAPPPPAIPVVNVGSPWTATRNLLAGLGTPADMFLWNQTMSDLVGTPAHRDGWLEKTSITGFMRTRAYTTDKALAGTYRTTAQAFASPSYLSSARSYKSLLSYGLRLPEPSMWLLDGNTETALFTPWLRHLARLARAVTVTPAALAAHPPFHLLASGSGGRLTLRLLTAVQSLGIDPGSGRVATLGLAPCARSPSLHRGADSVVQPLAPAQSEPLAGDLILALPVGQLRSLVTPQVAALAPELANLQHLRCEPMISMDLFFRRKLASLPRGITVLLDSPYEMSFLDTSQTWAGLDSDATVLNVIASNADALTPRSYSDDDIIRTLLAELRHYITFADADLFDCRTHLQTNVGEELFVNQVGSWQWRPRTTCGIANLYVAGDYCRSVIDVVTIEGAVVSGLMAAEALRRCTGAGPPIRIQEPDAYPVLPLAALAAAQRPAAYLARAVSAGDDTVRRHYAHWFPNG